MKGKMMGATFKRIEPGLYRAGDVEIRDQYSPDGPPHCRAIAKNGRRWAVTKGTAFLYRAHTLAEAKEYAAKHAA
jgi:hypothetical protein